MSRSSTTKGPSVKLTKARKDQITQLLDFDLERLLEEGLRGHMHGYMKLLAELLLNSEVLEIVGQRGARNKERTAYRWASQPGSISLMEQKVPIDKPRLRTAGKNGSEIELKTYQALNDPSFLNEQAGVKLLCGLSTRNVPKALESILDGRGISRQTISNRGIAEMTLQLNFFKNRDFGKTDKESLQYLLQQRAHFFEKRAALAKELDTAFEALNARTAELRPELEEILSRAKPALRREGKAVQRAQEELERPVESRQMYEQLVEELDKAVSAFRTKGDPYWRQVYSAYAKYPELERYQAAREAIESLDGQESAAGYSTTRL